MQTALAELRNQHSLFDQLYLEYGAPPLWQRAQSFATLVHIILEQKVSLASAGAVMKRVRQLCPGMRVQEFLQIPERDLLAAGMSRSKQGYCRSVAQYLIDGRLDLSALRRYSDQAVLDRLATVKGIGPWTAGVYLMMALRRPDAWASGDRALVLSYQHSKQLKQTPTYAQLDAIAMNWAPYRGTAARLLWHAYLERRH